MWEKMQHTMKTLWGNLKEAERYIRKAEECDHKGMKHWFLTMAEKHLSFDEEGIALLQEQMADMERGGHRPELMPGVKEVYGREIEDVRHEMKQLQEELSRHK